MPSRPDRRAWEMLKETYGDTIARALWSGRNIHFVAGNGDLFEIGQGSEEPSGVFLFNVTQGKKYCVLIQSQRFPQIGDVYHCNEDYPVADRLFNIMELLRVAPERIEEVAEKWSPRQFHEGWGYGALLGQRFMNPEITITEEGDTVISQTIPDEVIQRFLEMDT